MRAIEVENNGTGIGTVIKDANTGEILKNVVQLSINFTAESLCVARLQLYADNCNNIQVEECSVKSLKTNEWFY